MRHLAYSSLAEDIDLHAFQEIVAFARARNQIRKVRGVIAFDGRIVTQILEGEAEAVDGLFRIILRDPRHSGIVLTNRVDIAASQFRDFGMARLSPSEVYLMSSSIADRHGGGDQCADPLVLDT